MQMWIPLVVAYRIAKIKCLAYIINTFGIRNQFKKITGNIDSDQRLIRIFFQNWSIPKELHSTITPYLHGIYSRFSEMDETTRKEKYLEVVEEFFNTPRPNNFAFRALFGYPNDMSASILPHMPNLYVLSLGNIGILEFERRMEMTPEALVNNVPSLGKNVEGKYIVILSGPNDNAQKINGITKGLISKGAAHVFVNPENRQVILDELAANATAANATAANSTAANATAANATATADDSTAESLLYIVVFLGLPIACGKSSITRELLKRLPNSASVSKEGGSKSEFKNKISVLVKDLNLKLMVVDKNHPDPNGAASTFALILEVLRYTQRPVRVLAVVPDKLDSYDIIECRIADRIGLTTSEAGGSTFIPGAKGLEGDKWRYAFRVNFYEPSLQFLNTFKKTSGALIVDIIQTSPEENASIIVNTLLSEELVGVPLSD
ncbi:hypothetical protein EBY67_06165, partial [bacterium]|nr:hypothetical protein [bacterium]